jgi:hypothetical protein
MRLRLMLRPEEYRSRAQEARKQASACRNEWERQGLLMIAQQCERLAAYKELISPAVATDQARASAAGSYSVHAVGGESRP